jgi:hypothetical protein
MGTLVHNHAQYNAQWNAQLDTQFCTVWAQLKHSLHNSQLLNNAQSAAQLHMSENVKLPISRNKGLKGHNGQTPV